MYFMLPCGRLLNSTCLFFTLYLGCGGVLTPQNNPAKYGPGMSDSACAVVVA